jgi:hypothetical protein
MRRTFLFPLLLGLAASFPLCATEVYRWVDDDGVIHFSQNAPHGDVGEVEQMTLDDSAPSGYDPEEDIYGVEAMAAEMALLREQMEERRELAQERQQSNVQQTVVQYQPAVQYGYPYLGTPLYPGYRPPLRPMPPPPRPDPYPSLPFSPPGQNR